MMKRILAVSWVVLACGLSTAFAASTKVEPFCDGEKVGFLGDSISHNGHFVVQAQLYWNFRHPGSNIRLETLGRSGERAGEGLTRWAWDGAPDGFDRVFIMFGMNDFHREELWKTKAPKDAAEAAAREKDFVRYDADMRKLVDRISEDGVKVVLCTPTPYCAVQKAGCAPLLGCNDALGRATEIVRQIAAEKGLPVVDWWELLTKAEAADPSRTLCPDRVHPSAATARLMTAELLKAMGEPDDVLAELEREAKTREYGCAEELRSTAEWLRFVMFKRHFAAVEGKSFDVYMAEQERNARKYAAEHPGKTCWWLHNVLEVKKRNADYDAGRSRMEGLRLKMLPQGQNTALYPCSRLEKDSYDWFERHERILREQKVMDPEIVFVGDSITHFWAGRHTIGGADASERWKKTFGKWRTLNLGFGWDRIQNVLWRLDHGEMDGLKPRKIVLHIGTNNISDTPNARANTAAEIAEGTLAVIRRLHAKAPEAQIIVMAIFPREEKAGSHWRVVTAESNALLEKAVKDLPYVTYLDIGKKFLEPDGTLPKTMMFDFCHPADAGYAVWADAILPLLDTNETLTPVPNANEVMLLEREKMMSDPFRPKFHFVIDGDGHVGDPNGAFYHDGKYHLMFLYKRADGFRWGHCVSHDALRWRLVQDAIGPEAGQPGGCFSGGGFVDEDGTAYLSYWMLWGARGLGIAKSTDPDCTVFRTLDENPVIKSTSWGWTREVQSDGTERVYASADPSNIWKRNGKYYLLAGNLCLLNDLGRKTDSPERYKGDCAYLFESADLKSWRYLHPFYQRRTDESRASGWTDPDEDCMCPSFLPLPRAATGGAPSDKHLLLFISHNRGCQYYIGSYGADNRFTPETHGRMTWNDKSFFAPEALIDGRGRQIVWTWLLDNRKGDLERYGWSGVYGLPRTLWLAADGTLGIAPIDELKTLRTRPRRWENLRLAAGAIQTLDGFAGDCCELEIEVPRSEVANLRLEVRGSADGSRFTTIAYDPEQAALTVSEHTAKPAAVNDFCAHVASESAPLKLAANEPLRLRVYIDASVLDVFANDRQAITRRVYPDAADKAIRLRVVGGALSLSVQAWEIIPTNAY